MLFSLEKRALRGYLSAVNFRVISSNTKNTEQLEFSYIASRSKIDIVWGIFL